MYRTIVLFPESTITPPYEMPPYSSPELALRNAREFVVRDRQAMLNSVSCVEDLLAYCEGYGLIPEGVAIAA